MIQKEFQRGFNMKIIAVGDVSLGREIPQSLRSHSFPDHLIQKMKGVDIVFCNLECPLTSSLERQKNHYSKILGNSCEVFLKSDPENCRYLHDLNINLVSLGNNHILDYGNAGLYETIEVLDLNKIRHIGANKNLNSAKPIIIHKEGLRIGFIGYSFTYEATEKTPGCIPLRPKRIIQDIKNLKKQCDFVFLSLHFGEEFSNYASKKEISFCHSFIDAGASVILGHHPHVLRGIENYHNGIIAYSLGNFIFDSHLYELKENPHLKENTQESIFLEFVIKKDTEISLKIFPVYIDANGLPSCPDAGKSQEIMNKINNLNKALTNPRIKNFNLVNSIQKLKILISIIFKSIITGNFQNLYLLLIRFVEG